MHAVAGITKAASRDTSSGPVIEFNNIFSANFIAQLLGNQRLPKSARSKVVRDVADELITKFK